MKIGILISGRGSNMLALLNAVKSGEIPSSEVTVVISDRQSAAGLVKACREQPLWVKPALTRLGPMLRNGQTT